MIWNAEQAARFLRHCHHTDPLFADLVELIIGTGMRKGEALGLHRNDVHLDQRVLYVRQALSAIDNNQVILAPPKTHASKNWIAISDRVAAALTRRLNEPAPADNQKPGGGYVFAHRDGQPLHPGYVLNHFHALCDEAGVPRCTVHDLRHLAATISITNGIPLTVVSKTLRHSTLSTTANIYAHLTTQAARQAVDTIDNTLTHADHLNQTSRTPTTAQATRRPPRDHTTEPRDTTKHHVKPTIRQHRSRRRNHHATTTRPRHTP